MSRISFQQKLQMEQVQLKKTSIDTLQVNLGKRCNQACLHCHVDAGPHRTEVMSEKSIDRVIELMGLSPELKTLDLTGGAPEMHPQFAKIVIAARMLNLKVIDRCNLTVLFENGCDHIARFLKHQKVHIIASLPCYTQENVDKQRGKGVFDKSIEALRLLNSMGFGRDDSDLKLDLVYNPGGAYLPGDQKSLEIDYKEQLAKNYNIEFNNLLTITNMPIKRFLNDLLRENKFELYMELLAQNFNPRTLDSLMCKTLVSISWDGKIYDCDFNQMLELPVTYEKNSIWTISSLDQLIGYSVALTDHCYGCTAGAGSSCGGSLFK